MMTTIVRPTVISALKAISEAQVVASKMVTLSKDPLMVGLGNLRLLPCKNIEFKLTQK